MAKRAGPKQELPVQQLAILAVTRLAEPISATSIFPYLPHMIRDFGVPRDKVAKWAGITSASFSISQSMFAVPWGRASDRFGRKPVLIWGLISTMICTLVWGVSTSLPMAITVRAVSGAGNGNVGIIRTMVAEMVTNKELQPMAFSIMPLVWSLGSVAGPAFGGFFAQPAKQFPGVFGDIDFFNRFPYALPNLVAAIFFLISTFSAVFFLEETHRDKKNAKDWGLLVGQRLKRALRRRPEEAASQRRRSFVDGEATAPLIPTEISRGSNRSPPSTTNKTRSQAPPGPKRNVAMSEVFTYQTAVALAAYTFLSFHSVAFDQTFTVFLDYPVISRTPENTSFPFKFTGGFGLDAGTIGTIFVFYGVICGLVQFLLYPPLVQKFGVLRCFKLCSVLTPLVYLLTPFASLFPTAHSRLIAVLALLALKAFVIIIAFPSTTILVTNSATSIRILGTLNGFATMFAGLGRALGPASTGMAFSWGAERGYIVTGYFFLAFVAAVGAVPAFYIVEGDGPSAELDDDDDESNGSLSAGGSAVEDSEEVRGESLPLLGSKKDSKINYDTTTGGSSR